MGEMGDTHYDKILEATHKDLAQLHLREGLASPTSPDACLVRWARLHELQIRAYDMVHRIGRILLQ